MSAETRDMVLLVILDGVEEGHLWISLLVEKSWIV